MKLITYIIIAVFLIIPTVCGSQPFDTSPSVDREIVRKIDLTGDGVEETVILHVKGKNFYSPFSWTLTIKFDGKEVFRSEKDGAWFDAFFCDENYVQGCKGYLACKNKFFFHNILGNLIVLPNRYSVEGMLDKAEGNTLYQKGRAYLEQCCGISGQKADSILSGMAGRLRNGKAIVINILTSPETVDPPMMFAPEVNRFMPIYED